jgi:hypothetical protein
MTMHLTRHTTTGKRRAKFKYASAEHKRQALELEQNWTELKQRHASKTVAPTTNKQNKMKKYKLEIPANRVTPHIPSLNSGVGNAVKKNALMYTGSSMIGISTLHKSNSVPVFSQQDAIDISKMRRG